LEHGVNYFEFYVGDYARDTRHCSLAEHGAFLMLLSSYYATEKPLPADYVALYRICSAMAPEEQAAVRSVADAFFPVAADGLRHNARADVEIPKALARIEKARTNGKRGGRPPKEPSGNPAGFDPVNRNETQPLTEPLTGIEPAGKAPHTPYTKQEKEQKKGARTAPLELPDWLDGETWGKWHQYRNAGPRWTHEARRLSLQTLTKLRSQGHDPLAVIEQSIESGWTRLFPIKETSHENRRANGTGSAVERVQAAIAAGRAAREYPGPDPSAIDGTVVASHG
jgi:uncharacterized protein YdaU (DUF1376 family)